jgi:hypothetical protein
MGEARSRLSPLEVLREGAARHGLALRGTFAPGPDDAVPPVADGVPARALVLLGNVGASLWPAFSASPEFADGAPHPLDRWSTRIGEDLARSCQGRALYPFGGPPHHPFQRWALRAGAMFASPVGMLVDAQHGLWHAFRFAITLREPLDTVPPSVASPCASCTARACLHACPVNAFVEGEYRYRQCADYLVANPDAPCWRVGCLARHACPVGQADRYLPQQANFHMRAFVARRSVTLPRSQ